MSDCASADRYCSGHELLDPSTPDPISPRRGSLSRPTRQQCVPVCREIPQSEQLRLSYELCRKATQDVALARGCPPAPRTCTRLVPAPARRAKAGNTIGPFAGLLSKPSDGLEPSTHSLPWRFWGDTGGHGRALTTTFHLQIVASRCVWRARMYPRVHRLLYPSRTRGSLSVCKTSNESVEGDRRASGRQPDPERA
jgi:hypothetical protein